MFGLVAVLWGQTLLIAALSIVSVVVAGLLLFYGRLWLQAKASSADVSIKSLIGMTFRQVPARMIVTAIVMAKQSGLNVDAASGITTERLEAHYLAGGDVLHVMRAIIAAHRARIPLDFDQAAAVELAGRDALDAVQTSVIPKVIDCPDESIGKRMLSAVAKNGVELKVKARVTVRVNMAKLIGGATEKTIIARVGQGIITTIGSAESHMDVLAMPDSISKQLLSRGLDSNTAFEIVSIDIVDMDIGANIGARLHVDQARADMRSALAQAEARRANAVAAQREMSAKISEKRAELLAADATAKRGLANAVLQPSTRFTNLPPIRIGTMSNDMSDFGYSAR